MLVEANAGRSATHKVWTLVPLWEAHGVDQDMPRLSVRKMQP